MIIFCEECGARNDLDSDGLDHKAVAFACCQCAEMLVVSAPSLGSGGCNILAGGMPDAAMQKARSPVTVLIVDDSAVLRKILKEIFYADGQLQVVGEAQHGLDALKRIPELKPDVVTLDVNMPVMDGLTAIKHIMIKSPTPVVMFSTLTGQGALETFEALRYGAVDFLQKPSSLLKEDLKSQQQLIVSRVKNAAHAGIGTIRYLRPVPPPARATASTGRETCRRVFAIGSSYGGYGSLLGLIPELDPALPVAYVCVLYATRSHVDAFARYLDGLSAVAVDRIRDGQRLCPGTCYLASVSETVAVNQPSNDPLLQFSVSRARQVDRAADELMSSLSMAMGQRVSGILLSGVGRDGIVGIGKILGGGGSAMVQAPETCLCGDAPATAIRKYGLSAVPPGARMAETIRADYVNACQ